MTVGILTFVCAQCQASGRIILKWHLKGIFFVVQDRVYWWNFVLICFLLLYKEGNILTCCETIRFTEMSLIHCRTWSFLTWEDAMSGLGTYPALLKQPVPTSWWCCNTASPPTVTRVPSAVSNSAWDSVFSALHSDILCEFPLCSGARQGNFCWTRALLVQDSRLSKNRGPLPLPTGDSSAPLWRMYILSIAWFAK